MAAKSHHHDFKVFSLLNRVVQHDLFYLIYVGLKISLIAR